MRRGTRAVRLTARLSWYNKHLLKIATIFQFFSTEDRCAGILSMRMTRGFYTIMAAQFFSSLADNALLIVSIELLAKMQVDESVTPLLKLFFVLSYVLLAPFVGAFADSRPKSRVMFITNLIKITGCAMMFFSIHPLLAYAVVGFGAAAYSPAKYGILTELLPPEKLVHANAWIEGLTVLSIIFGTMLGGQLIRSDVSAALLSIGLPSLPSAYFNVDTPTEMALYVITLIYLIAGLFNLRIPDTGVRYPHQAHTPSKLIADFAQCFSTLWKDQLGQISLAITTLFWGAAVTLQFIVLKWAEHSLHMPLSQATVLQGMVALGVALGAISAARLVPLKKSLSVMGLGIAMGVVVTSMTLVSSLQVAYPLLILIGVLGGFIVVPMNALLQHRGHVLLSAGHSIAVQNFNENLSILLMLALYAIMIKLDLHINTITVMFGAFLIGITLLVMRKHQLNQRRHNSLALIGERKH